MKKQDNKIYYTYGMIKPDGMKYKEEIIRKIYGAGLEIHYYDCDMLTEDIIDENYAHVKGRDFYKQMKENLLSGPVLKMLIYDKEGDAVNKYRKVLGKTKSWEALPDTIRGTFGNKTIAYLNVAHGSGTNGEALDEVLRFFKPNMLSLIESVRFYSMVKTVMNNNPQYTDAGFVNQGVMRARAAYKKFETKSGK